MIAFNAGNLASQAALLQAGNLLNRTQQQKLIPNWEHRGKQLVSEICQNSRGSQLGRKSRGKVEKEGGREVGEGKSLEKLEHLAKMREKGRRRVRNMMKKMKKQLPCLP